MSSRPVTSVTPSSGGSSRPGTPAQVGQEPKQRLGAGGLAPQGEVQTLQSAPVPALCSGDLSSVSSSPEPWAR